MGYGSDAAAGRRAATPPARSGFAEGPPQEPRVHLAFTARTHGEVRAFHAAALAAGGRDNGPPGYRPRYHTHYYAAFVLDPDGYNIEAVCHRADATD